ncbi:hypothetical protein [Enemella sp. A6]|uniref:hypothetical protein n=1 Tax=Enemella sp. A6 TaxID=3440152 RepID=UPI003EC008D6
MGVNFIRAALAREAHRPAAALIGDAEQVWEVSVSHPTWVVRGAQLEWRGDHSGVRCWRILTDGARPVAHDHPDHWVHPMVAMLWTERLPIWGRPGDLFTPVRVISGTRGPSQVVLEATTGPVVGGYRMDPGGTLHIDWSRWVCTRLELPTTEWTVEEYRRGA